MRGDAFDFHLSETALDGEDAPARALLTSAAAPADIDYGQLLRDRPDVFQAFFTEYHSANNDHGSSAWIDRVGGVTPIDYARYWYANYGQYGDYTPDEPASSAGIVRAPIEDADGGRTTADGISLDQILLDRPDVFQAFFTEYYGVNNDRHSHAWVDRVGGATPQDYANYWYETYGKYGAYRPTHGAPAAADDDHTPAPPVEPAQELDFRVNEDGTIDMFPKGTTPPPHVNVDPPVNGDDATPASPDPDAVPDVTPPAADEPPLPPLAMALHVEYLDDGVILMTPIHPSLFTPDDGF